MRGFTAVTLLSKVRLILTKRESACGPSEARSVRARASGGGAPRAVRKEDGGKGRGKGTRSPFLSSLQRADDSVQERCEPARIVQQASDAAQQVAKQVASARLRRDVEHYA